MQLDHAIHVRSYPGAPRGGDVGVVRELEDGAFCALVDATGHGLTAYAVAQAARKFLLATELDDPSAVLLALDDLLKGGIGAAVSVARIRGADVTFAGVGNVEAMIAGSPLIVRPGTVGLRMRTPRVQHVRMDPGMWFLMHTDGVSSPRAMPTGSAETVARRLVDERGSTHDDAGVLVARWLETLA